MRARPWLLPLLRERFGALAADEIGARFERNGLPFAPITQPQELFDDPHLLATGGLAPVRVPADASGAQRGVDTRTALLPLTLDGERLPLRSGPPALGAQTSAILQSLGMDADEIESLRAQGVVGGSDAGG